MEFRMAKRKDIEEIMLIIKKAQDYLKSEGIDQWQNGYPNKEAIEKDIDNNHFYVLIEEDVILGITALSFDGEMTYDNIYEGKWITNDTYGVIHRMAVDLDNKRKGLASIILREAEKVSINKKVYSIKVDTHRNNIGMQKLLEKNGFKYCGIIYLRDGNERVAFEKVLEK